MAMSRTTMLYIRKALEQCGECPGFHGAVLSTPDGLVLASSGKFDADESAACASGLMVNTAASLGQLAAQGPTEMLIWGADNTLWNVSLLAGDYILLVASAGTAGADRLRRTRQRAGEMLNQALRILV
ncbi:Roadblock/LC7 domain-containing protein [Fluviicoccus keumensis]|uniref:Roadblock/LC7 domain-containing protein n=1 Tax=Fluviicoccus keumensis TaxID=1435465 RepID=A0A4Q7YN77_9GAMM|nr:roadblock/LC7 domain-containing protein [Fluviicoccus keumensis]RZU38444.1 Roadblock/LC7 domain-containing protein [Fluviicoccus keumensis]